MPIPPEILKFITPFFGKAYSWASKRPKRFWATKQAVKKGGAAINAELSNQVGEILRRVKESGALPPEFSTPETLDWLLSAESVNNFTTLHLATAGGVPRIGDRAKAELAKDYERRTGNKGQLAPTIFVIDIIQKQINATPEDTGKIEQAVAIRTAATVEHIAREQQQVAVSNDENFKAMILEMRSMNAKLSGQDLPPSLAPGINVVQSLFSSEVDSRFEDEIEEVRKGNLVSVAEKLAKRRRQGEWEHLAPELQAKIIRLQASISLQRGSLEEAERFLAEADTILVSGGVRLRALIRCKKEGPVAALSCFDTTIDLATLQLKVSILLEARKFSEADELLSSVPLKEEQDAETQRLRAFSALLQGRREEAYSWIQKAEEIAPSWTAVIRGGAIIRYALALSPAAPEAMFLLPNPVNRDLVKDDSGSQQLLMEALPKFQKLLSLEADPTQRDIDATWELACLCNVRDKAETAQRHCLGMLNTNPGHPLFVGWAIVRGFDFDKRRSLDAFQKILAEGGGDSSHVFACGWILLAEDRIADAKDTLEKYKDRFTSEFEEHVRQERIAGLENVLGYSDPASYQNDAAAIVPLFESAISEAPISPIGLVYAYQLAELGEWDVLYKGIDKILIYETGAATRIAAYAAYNLKQPARALEILNTRKNDFLRATFPIELRRLQINAVVSVSGFAAAVGYAESLAADTGALEDRLEFANLLLSAADVVRAVPIIRAALNEGTFSSTDRLKYCEIIAREDIELAKALWRSAMAKGIEDEHLSTALSIGYKLGLDNEVGALFPRLIQIANRPGSRIVTKSLEEVISMTSNGNSRMQQNWEQYANGRIPVHIMAEANNFDVARIYRLHPPSLVPSAANNIPFIRNGGRDTGLGVGRQLDNVTLYMDLTALLVAAQLQLLDVIEKLNVSIVIPASTATALLALEEQLAPGQPALFRAYRQIFDAIARKRVNIWSGATRVPAEIALGAACQSATDKAGLAAVHQLPPEGSEVDCSKLTSLESIAEGLRLRGAIAENVFRNIRVKNGRAADGGVDFGQIPDAGTVIIFTENTLVSIAQMGLLEEVITGYDVYVDDNLVTYINLALKQADEDAKFLALIAELRHRVIANLDSRRFSLTAIAATMRGSGSVEEDLNMENAVSRSPISKCLFEMLNMPTDTNTFFWVDDRFSNGCMHNGQVPIFGVLEILNELRNAKQIADEVYYRALVMLRASMAMFFPISEEELDYHLNSVLVANGQIVENANLATLRRYFSKFASLEKYLKLDGQMGQPIALPDEIYAIQRSRALVSSAIVRVWNKHFPEIEDCEAKSNWIWQSMRVEHTLSRGDAIQTEASFIGALCGALLVNLFQLKVPEGQRLLAMRDAYNNWAAGKIVAPRVRRDKSIARHAADFIKRFIPQIVDHGPNNSAGEQEEMVWRRYIGSVIQKFPPEICAFLWEDSQITELIPVISFEQVTIAGFNFNARDYFSNVAAAMNGEPRQIEEISEKRLLLIEKHPTEKYGVILNDGEQQIPAFDDAYALLIEADDACRSMLQQNIAWFDTCKADRTRQIESIMETADKCERIFKFDDARRKSAELHYFQLEREFRSGGRLTLSKFFPPSTQSLLSYSRLQSDCGTDFSAGLHAGGVALIQDYGKEGAFHRLSALPSPIPQCVIDAFAAEDKSSLDAILARLLEKAVTPLSFLHTLRLFRELNAIGAPRVSEYIESCVCKWEDMVNSFAILLRWTAEVAKRDTDWNERSLTEQLAAIWIHASRITQLLHAYGVTLESVISTFAAQGPIGFADSMFVHPPQDTDIASPQFVFSESLLFHGLSYVLDGTDAASVFSPKELTLISDRLLMSLEDGNTKIVRPIINVNRGTLQNRLQSFLAIRHAGLLGSDFDASVQAAMDFEHSAVGELNTDMPLSPRWTDVQNLFWATLNDLDKEQVRTTIRNLSFQTLLTAFNENAAELQSVLQLAAKFDANGLRESVRSKIFEIASHEANRFASQKTSFTLGDGSERGTALGKIVYLLGWLSQSSDVLSAYRFYAESLLEISTIWPGSTREIRDYTQKIYEASTFRNAKPIWDAQMSLQTRF